jgi:hypothetical protein
LIRTRFGTGRPSAETIRTNRKRLNSLGINYLINVGPDGLGRIPGPSVDILRAARQPARGNDKAGVPKGRGQ